MKHILIGLCLACISSAHASVPPLSERIAQTMRRELHATKGTSFADLLQKWNERYGSQAVSPLLQISSDLTLEDSKRYAALMGAARLGGTATSPLIVRFLKDRSWMLRSGALRALAALEDPRTSRSVLPLIDDPALVVRMEAVAAIEKLRPAGAVGALLHAIEDPKNFHAKKAQWIPLRALAALKVLRARESAARLRPLLDRYEDPELQKSAVDTLSTLLGKNFSPKLALSQKIAQLKLSLKN